MLTRRTFLALSVLAATQPRRMLAQGSVATAVTTAATTAGPTRLDVAAIDRIRILAAASVALTRLATPSADLNAEDFLQLTLDIPTLAAAAYVEPQSAALYTKHAATQLQAWFVTPATRLVATTPLASPEILSTLGLLAELIIALPFLHLPTALLAELRQWFQQLLTFLTEDRTALLARDAKSHAASSHLLLVSALARFTANDAVLADCRHRFKATTLRSQITAAGIFPHELTSQSPYRDSLFNLDLLAGVCMLLSTRFESVWDYELQDGPGMRAAIARFAPYIRSRRSWPYPADTSHFQQLPCRRPALLFAARAYAQPDYAALWLTLNADPTDSEVLRAFPIRQPLLWTAQPRRAAAD